MTIVLTTLGVTLALMATLWVVSLLLRDASIVDIFWGLGFVVIAWTSFLTGDSTSFRSLLVCLMVTLWGIRLAAHLARRNLGHGEDYRYRQMREKWGARFPIVSLGTVFLLQGMLMWIVSLPIQAVQLAGDRPLGVLDAIGFGLWVVGLAIETVADAQLSAFKHRPGTSGRVMNEGLWRYSRHPNYFGDFLVWWGLGAMATSAGMWWAVVGPAVMTILLLKVSGVALLESTIGDRRPGYGEYASRTSAFFPWPPRSRP